MAIVIQLNRRLSIVVKGMLAPTVKLLSVALTDRAQIYPQLSSLNKTYSTKDKSILCLKPAKSGNKAPLWYSRSRFQLGNWVRGIICKTSRPFPVIKSSNSNIWWTGRKRSFTILQTRQRLKNKIDVLSKKFKAIWKTCHSPKCKTWTSMTTRWNIQAQNQ